MDIGARPAVVEFLMDLVLTPEHPEYKAAGPEEQHCFRRGRLVLGVEYLLWEAQGAPPAKDAWSELDYGNIDSLTYEGAGYALRKLGSPRTSSSGRGSDP